MTLFNDPFCRNLKIFHKAFQNCSLLKKAFHIHKYIRNLRESYNRKICIIRGSYRMNGWKLEWRSWTSINHNKKWYKIKWETAYVAQLSIYNSSSNLKHENSKLCTFLWWRIFISNRHNFHLAEIFSLENHALENSSVFFFCLTFSNDLAKIMRKLFQNAYVFTTFFVSSYSTTYPASSFDYSLRINEEVWII